MKCPDKKSDQQSDKPLNDTWILLLLIPLLIFAACLPLAASRLQSTSNKHIFISLGTAKDPGTNTLFDMRISTSSAANKAGYCNPAVSGCNPSSTGYVAGDLMGSLDSIKFWSFKDNIKLKDDLSITVYADNNETRTVSFKNTGGTSGGN